MGEAEAGAGSNRATLVLRVHHIRVRPNRRDCQKVALLPTLLQPSVLRSHLQVRLVARDVADAETLFAEYPAQRTPVFLRQRDNDAQSAMSIR